MNLLEARTNIEIYERDYLLSCHYGDYRRALELAEKLYEMIYDKDFKDLSRKIPPSDLWALSADTIDGNFSKEQFIDQIKNYAESGNDLDIKEVAGAIYDKFISG